jgi:bifunctional non-homologous end joining protein LigD
VDDVALDDYKRKRNFRESPEPEGDQERTRASRRGQPRFFCVQKHLASHLHYDFRIEHDGVLLSWAVPKGPSLDPKTKRLAMKVEDHPFEYGTFEGVIPSGYGAGIVMLWDVGTWTPLADDVDAALAKGDLKFELDGYKLKGSWVLVRTRAWGKGQPDDGRSWLLIKHRDDWAGDVDIVEFAPLSVKSGHDLHEILAEEQPDLWVSNRDAPGGAAGAMLREIIDKAAALKSARPPATRTTDATRPSRTATTTRARKPPANTNTTKKRTSRTTAPARRARRKP